MIHLGVLHTRPIEDHDIGEIGEFFLDVELDEKFFFADSDKPGLIRRTISLHFASAVQDTKVPQEYWYFSSSTWLQKHFNFPKILNFGAVK